MKKLLSLFLIVLIGISFYSCDSDDEPSCETLEQQIVVLALTFLDEAFAYDADPSQANCEKVADTLEDLIQKSEQARKCVPEDELDQYDEDVQDFRDALAALPC